MRLSRYCFIVAHVMEIFSSYFYWIDFAIGSATPMVVYALYRSGKIDGFVWRLFWIGCALGLTWELPLSLINEYSECCPVATFIQPLPTHFSVIVITHSFWDGGLFLAGVALVYLICGKDSFEEFRVRELAVLVVYGQVSEIIVELLSTFNDAWAYVPYWWNPSMFKFNGHDITPLPQVIWLVAPIVFYFIALRAKSRMSVFEEDVKKVGD